MTTPHQPGDPDNWDSREGTEKSTADQATEFLNPDDAQSERASSDDFESGLDYAAFMDDEPNDTDTTTRVGDGVGPADPTDPADPTQPQATTPMPAFLRDSNSNDANESAQHAATGQTGDQKTEVLADHEAMEDDRTEVIGSGQRGQHAAPAAQHTVPMGAAVPASGGFPESAGIDNERRNRREAEARATARDDALDAPRTVSRVLQVLLAIFAPLVLLIAVVRAVASPVFLWLEYRRPGFPADDFGFSTGDRTTYGSYGLDYLFNLASPQYLEGLTTSDGSALFTASEVSHMYDVKMVILIAMLVGLVLGIACIVFMIVLARTHKGAIRRALFAGSIWLLIAMIVVAVLAVLGWGAFFAGFHSLFFADGTWTFFASDTLIRLYPNQFWIDAGIVIAALTLITAVITLVLTWPTRRRREDSRQAQIHKISRKNYWAEETY